MIKFLLALIVVGILVGGAWVVKTQYLDPKNEVAQVDRAPTPVPSPSPSPTPFVVIKDLPITLPLVDALFHVDPQFSADLKSDLHLTDQQVVQLRQAAREETANLQEDNIDATTAAAGERAAEKISAIIGAEKAQQFANFSLERWQTGGDSDSAAFNEAAPPPVGSTPGANASPSPSATPGTAKPMLMPSAPFSAPADTRIVVNAPAHRLDVFENGQLVKSYAVGIGYPEFPLPSGMRQATQIIFNPTWTPPDEPWVESPSSKVKIGQKVPAGDKLNPLGVLKIPIGLPSLIHGGKQPSKIGSFASHGCVGMTDEQAKSFAKVLAQLGGVSLTDEEIARYEKNRKETKVVKLATPVPVELRYETMVVEDGKLHVYRDVYDRDTNVRENLETALAAYGLTLEDLTPQERERAMAALTAMSRPPDGKASSANLTEEQKAEQRRANIERQRLTRQVKGQKEIVVDIAALTGKGYPAPVEMETGKPPQPEPTPARKKRK